MRFGYFFRQVLLAMLVAVALPLVVVQVLAGYRQYNQTRDDALAAVQHHADASAQVLQSILERSHRSLGLAAARLAERDLGPAQCSAYLRDVFSGDTLYANAAVLDAQGAVLCSAAPVGLQTLAGPPKWLVQAREDRPAALTPADSALSGEPASVLAVRIPLATASPARVLALALRVSEIGRALPLSGEGSVTAVLDRDGNLLTRNPEPFSYLGRRPPWRGHVLPGHPTEATGLDGPQRYFAVSLVGTDGVQVYAGSPASVVEGPARASYVEWLVTAAGAGALAVLFAYVAARRLVRPVQQLAQTAQNHSEDQRTRADDSLPGEFGKLGLEFNRMLDARQTTECELEEVERQALRGKEQLFNILETAMDAIVTVDAKLRIVVFNRAASDLLGITAEQALGKSVCMLLPERFRAQTGGLLTRAGQGCAVARRKTMTAQRADGTEIVLEMALSWVGEGPEELTTIIARDVTHEAKIEEARKALVAAESANLAKTEFLSRMSHELRTPLNAILGFSKLLKLNSGQKLNSTERQQLDLVCVAGDQLLALINDVLDLSRVEAGNLAVEKDVVYMGGFVTEVVATCQQMASEAGVSLAAHVTAHHRTAAMADTVRLRQVLMNLVSNAIKYNKPGGRVTVAVRDGGSCVCIDVKDTGLGLSPSQLQRLFEPFNRLGRDRTNIAGTGIGLVLTRHLVQCMNGKLSVTSEENVGSCFTICLPKPGAADLADPIPVCPQQAASQAGPAAMALRDVSGTVLCIEDNAANTLVVQQMLAPWSEVALLQASTAQQGLALAHEEKPDLILLDMRLPDADGLEVLAELRQSPQLAAIPVLVLSASAMPAEIQRALSAGARSFHPKPLQREALLAEVAQVLHEQRTRSALPA